MVPKYVMGVDAMDEVEVADLETWGSGDEGDGDASAEGFLSSEMNVCEEFVLPRMTTRFWRWYSERLFYKWEKTVLWDMVEPYRRPRSFTPLITVYTAAFYTGVVGSAITEQLYKEKYWEDHPGQAVPIMKPKFYWGPWRIMHGDVPK